MAFRFGETVRALTVSEDLLYEGLFSLVKYSCREGKIMRGNETFYFSELSAYLHTALSPNVSSIIIVPLTPTSMFGSLYQINAEANEILSSSATVDNIEIISAITAAAINANFSSVNNNITLGNI